MNNLPNDTFAIDSNKIKELTNMLKAANEFKSLIAEPLINDEAFLSFIILRTLYDKARETPPQRSKPWELSVSMLIHHLNKIGTKYHKKLLYVYSDEYMSIRSATPPISLNKYPNGWNEFQSALFKHILDIDPLSPIVAECNKHDFPKVAAFIVSQFEKNFTFKETSPERFITVIKSWPKILNQALDCYCLAIYPSEVLTQAKIANK